MSTRAVVINPMGMGPEAGRQGQHHRHRGYNVKPQSQAPPRESFWQRHSGKAKALMALGVVGLVGVVAFAAGGAQAGSGSTDSNGAVADAASLATAKAALTRRMSEFAVPESGDSDMQCESVRPNSTAGVLGSLNYAGLNALLDEYENVGEAGWKDAVMPCSVMKLLLSYRDEAVEQRALVRRNNAGRRLSVEPGSLRSKDEYRELAFTGSSDISSAWEKIESETYNNAVTFKTDRVNVRKEGSTCWIIAEETNEAGDWFNNLNAGSADILSIKKYNAQDKSCGCARSTLGYCREYNTCNTYKSIGKGFKGFVNTYNTMRLDIWNKIQSTCGTGLSRYQFAGYSRGAGIATPLVYALIEDGLIPKSRIRMHTFGSPRALDDQTSDILHNHMSGSTFRIDRLVNQQDIVPSIPFDWWGFKHVGNMDCFDCDYEKGRDRPFYAWSIPQHTKYCENFGDSRC